MSITGMQCTLGPEEIRALRDDQYNATVVAVVPVHPELRIVRIVPDSGVLPFDPGQYIALGLGNWEPRVADTDAEQLDATHLQRLAKRAYSISCSLLDDNGSLRRVSEFPYLEFYVTLVRHAQKHPPALTPRLFLLEPGDRLFVEPHAAGTYTLHAVSPANDVFFFATGTGEAPHNAMIAELLALSHRGRIVSVVSVRHLRDAAYRQCHEKLMRRYSNYHYVVLTTRDPRNVDRTSPDYIGKRYLQDLVRSGELERDTGVALNPQQSHVFLCGSPQMIGARPPSTEHDSGPLSGGMLKLLLTRGFGCDQPGQPGNVHFERYW